MSLTNRDEHRSRLFSLEGIIMLTLALILDGLGLIELIPIVGTILSLFIDICAILLIGTWIMFFKSKRPPTPETSRVQLGKPMNMGKWIVRIIAPAGELIPGVGTLPFWTLLVFIELITD